MPTKLWGAFLEILFTVYTCGLEFRCTCKVVEHVPDGLVIKRSFECGVEYSIERYLKSVMRSLNREIIVAMELRQDQR